MEQNMKLFELAIKGDKAAKEKIVSSNTGLVYSIARRHLGRGYELEDLYQVGCIGLLKAIDRFDFHFNVKFSTYAVPMIMGEIKRFIRDDGMIKVSRGIKEMATEINHARERIINLTGIEPGIMELSDETGISCEDINYVLEATKQVMSLYQNAYKDDGSTTLIMDTIEGEDYEEEVINHVLIENALATLTEGERAFITLRFEKEKTQVEIAKILGTSQVQISRLEKKIIKKLREFLVKA